MDDINKKHNHNHNNHSENVNKHNISKSVNINHIFRNPNEVNNIDKKIVGNSVGVGVNNIESNINEINANIPSDSNYNENSDLLNNNNKENYKSERKEEESIGKSKQEILDAVNRYKRNFMVKRRKTPLKINNEVNKIEKSNIDNNDSNNNIK